MSEGEAKVSPFEDTPILNEKGKSCKVSGVRAHCWHPQFDTPDLGKAEICCWCAAARFTPYKAHTSPFHGPHAKLSSPVEDRIRGIGDQGPCDPWWEEQREKCKGENTV